MQRLIVSTFICLLLFLTGARADNDGGEFLGKWILIQKVPDILITIEKGDQSYIVHWATYDFIKDVWKEDDQPIAATLHDGALQFEVARHKFQYVLDHANGHLKYGGLEFQKYMGPEPR